MWKRLEKEPVLLYKRRGVFIIVYRRVLKLRRRSGHKAEHSMIPSIPGFQVLRGSGVLNPEKNYSMNWRRISFAQQRTLQRKSLKPIRFLVSRREKGVQELCVRYTASAPLSTR